MIVIANSGARIVTRRRDSPLEIATGCASIRTVNHTRTTTDTERITRRAAITKMIEVHREKMIEIKMTEESRQDLTGDNS